MAEARLLAAEGSASGSLGIAGSVIIVLIWILVIVGVVVLAQRLVLRAPPQ
jgi:hypothetical protein